MENDILQDLGKDGKFGSSKKIAIEFFMRESQIICFTKLRKHVKDTNLYINKKILFSF
jgi:uncharacterized protein YuzE